ncbi:SusC/RagA family TonB-linked outer membrane protein [Pedobacter sp. MC2016-14]|uniref:SusC/RagA family TonB-linked outer membrane protein n=1 Tax=Pedobacter sp. MC2016-14 TaxID=2897327 RepID=UPI001E3CC225|nr:SusC/RagA family TonB-linked outer membrane protein [Pedobacter sp. MC2016-14]MCD0488193.1 SusC/RagA family TonB-linked outer membrane protein [Pedobacter sp. MC2016-14]
MQKVVQLLPITQFIKYKKRQLFTQFMLVMALLMLIAFNASSQDLSAKKVSLNLKGTTIKEAFNAVQKQSGITFVFSEDIKKYATVKVTLAEKDITVKRAIALILRNTNLKSTQVDDQVVIDEITIAIKGKVTDAETAQPIPGVSIRLKGGTAGAVSNNNGDYVIDVPNAGSVLLYSYIGFTAQEVAINGRTVLDVKLSPSAEMLNEVVTTALGIKREEKSLGYALTKVDGEEISKTAPGNWVNALSGKVPGLNISKAGAGPGGSVRITLRGQNSLDLDKGEPLIVIDGVPVTSGMVSNDGKSYGASGNQETPIDYGNALSEINPDDIKDVTVLRGPSAAALYGSRAASGAILITTKSNTEKKERLSVSFNSGITLDQVLRYPDLQYEYGAGTLAGNAYYSFGASQDGINTHSGASWGPGFENNGQEYFQFNPETQAVNSFRTPWVADKNYTKDAFKTGYTYNNTLSISGGDSKNSVRLSYNDQRNDYILSNTGYSFNRFSFSSNSKLNNLQFSTRVNYYHKGSDNLPLSGYNTNTYMYAVMYGSANIPFNWQRNYWVPGQEGITQSNRLNSAIDNPYFMLYENLNTLSNDRIFGNITATYTFNKEMSLQMRGGIDQSESLRTSRRPYSTERFAQGRYQEQTVISKEQNFDFLYKYDKQVSKNIRITTSIGGSTTNQELRNTTIIAERLATAGLYSLANSKDRPLVVPQSPRKVIQSLYGLSQFNYKNYLFLDVTGRNDWTSTLPVNNNSYFYYSGSASAVISEMFDLSAVEPLSFLKLRASLAQVANDTEPFRTNYSYQTSEFAGSYANPRLLPGGSDLKPEIITNRELGIDIRFFKSRLNFDLTYYNANSKNQILQVPIDPAGGASNRIFNAGLINNRGWEAAVTCDILGRSNKLKWKTTLTWSTNRSMIKELAPGIESIIMATGPRGYIEARVGGAVGDIYGSGYLRAPDGQIIHKDGLPQIDTENFVLQGSSVPDWKAGINNQFTIKNWSFGFLFDGQLGGKVYSFSHSVLASNGKLVSTIPGRYEGIVGEGVKQNADGTYSPNDVLVTASTYYREMYARDNMESNIFDVSYIKLREANLEYKFSDKFLKKIGGIRSASLVLFGRDLLLFTKFPLYDPEIATLNRNRIESGFETGQFPSTRSFGATLKASF